MPEGYWYVILAAVGWLSLAGNVQDHRGGREQRSNYGRSQQSIAAAPVVRVPANPPSRETTENKCMNAQGMSDDCARASAQATVDYVRYARWQAISAIVGVAVGGLTLIAAFLAAKWAKRAAEETKRSAIAAEGALEQVKQSSERELRAYVVAFPKKLEQKRRSNENYNVTLQIHLQNLGQTPAYRATQWLGMGVMHFENAQAMIRDAKGAEPESPNYAILSTGFPVAGIVNYEVTKDQVETIISGAAALYAFGEIHYTDIFEKRRTSQFCHQLSGREFFMAVMVEHPANSNREVVWMTAPFHNTAT